MSIQGGEDLTSIVGVALQRSRSGVCVVKKTMEGAWLGRKTSGPAIL